MNNERLQGMIDVLNKIAFKVSEEMLDTIISEANDIPGLNGYFMWNLEEIIFIHYYVSKS